MLTTITSTYARSGASATTILQLGAVLFTVVGLNLAISLHAAPSHTRTAKPELASQANRVDRSHKADRLPAFTPPVRIGLPAGCEPPFSSSLKISSPDLNARCLT